jgi:hypothetical protein
MKAEELAFKTHELTQKLRRTPMPLADLVPHLQEMADELRRLAALEKEGNDDLTIAYLSGHSKGAADTKAKLEQAITDPENQPSQYGTITLDEHEKKVSAITEKYSDAVDRFVKEREKVFALEQAAEPVAYVVAAQYEDGSHAGHRLEWRGRNEANDLPKGTPLYTHPAPRKPMTRDDMRKLLAEHFDNDELTGADFSLIRAVERFHKIEDKPC